MKLSFSKAGMYPGFVRTNDTAKNTTLDAISANQVCSDSWKTSGPEAEQQEL